MTLGCQVDNSSYLGQTFFFLIKLLIWSILLWEANTPPALGSFTGSPYVDIRGDPPSHPHGETEFFSPSVSLNSSSLEVPWTWFFRTHSVPPWAPHSTGQNWLPRVTETSVQPGCPPRAWSFSTHPVAPSGASPPLSGHTTNLALCMVGHVCTYV